LSARSYFQRRAAPGRRIAELLFTAEGSADDTGWVSLLD
jgi:hypothetical protein